MQVILTTFETLVVLNDYNLGLCQLINAIFMDEIEKYSSQKVSRIDLNLSKTIFQNSSSDEILELVISIDDKDINIKELSSYLDFIYRIDGILSDFGYLKYIHNRNAQIEISKIRQGSVELIVERLLNSIDSDKLVIIWLVLKYLPQIINTIADTTNKVYDVLLKNEELTEKKEKRRIRSDIRKYITNEIELTGLDKKQKEKLTNLLEDVYIKNKKRIIPSSRFSRFYVKDLKLVRRKLKNK